MDGFESAGHPREDDILCMILIWAGEIQEIIHDIASCQNLIDRIIANAKAIFEKQTAIFFRTHRSL